MRGTRQRAFDRIFEQRPGRCDPLLKHGNTVLANKTIRIDTVGEGGNARVKAVVTKQFNRAEGCPNTGWIRIKEENHTGDKPLDHGHMCLGQRGPQRGHNLTDAGLMRRNRIEIAFDDNQAAFARGRRPGAIESEQDTSFTVEERIRRVQVFRKTLVQDASPESHHVSLKIPNGEDYAAAETIIVPTAVTTLHDETDIKQFLNGPSLPSHGTQHVFPSRKGIPESKLRDRRFGQMTTCDIGPGLGRAWMGEQLLMKPRRRTLQKLAQPVLSIHLTARLSTLRKSQPESASELPHGLGKGQPLNLHEKGDGTTASAAAKAIKESLGGAHGK